MAARVQDGLADAVQLRLLGLLIENNLLGNVAYRVGRKIEWDACESQGGRLPRGGQVHPSRVPGGLDALS
jgi:hypothetical protein